MKHQKELPDPSTIATISLVGNKWKLYILKILSSGTTRFNEIHHSIPGISQKVLTDNLRSMEHDGTIIRTVYPEVPPHVEYRLSECGTCLIPLCEEMREWGHAHLDIQRTPKCVGSKHKKTIV